MISTIIRYSTNLEISKLFYETLLNIKFKHSMRKSCPEYYYTELDNIVFKIYPGMGSTEHWHMGTTLCFNIKDMSIISNLEELGGKVEKSIRNTEFGEVVVLQDPDKCFIELFKPNEHTI